MISILGCKMSKKMAVVHFLSVLLILGVSQANPVQHDDQPTFIENLRNGQRVVAGWEANEGQIPYQVSLRMISPLGAVSPCGGSVIHHNWVLTAAHCLANQNQIVVRFGLVNLTRPEFIVEATRKHIYPGYNELSVFVQTHDIALLGIDQTIPYGDFIQPCRLQNSENKNFNYAGVRLIVSGFGLTDDVWNGGTTSEVLRWVYLLGITNEECRSWYPSTNIIQEQTICAEYYNDTAQSSCEGDSGGPLTIVDEDGEPTLVGVVSFGSSAGCNSPFPAGFVRPGHYHDWYLEVTGLNFDWSQADISNSAANDLTREKPIVVNS